MLQLYLIFGLALVFFVTERIWPGRHLPETPGWYARATFLSACQLSIVVLAGRSWSQWFHGYSLFSVAYLMPPIEQGATGWFIGTLVFYWWHRARHDVDFLWRVFHQVHHSPSRIEVLTSFYKHPLEMAANSVIYTLILFPLLGASVEGAAWFNVFAAVGEYFYHANLRTPHWFGYFIQRPEHHSIHHQTGVHRFNFGDITWWDRAFGTFRDTDEFSAQCGFPEAQERNLTGMLALRRNS
jgi:sterol desaturase/sphingolipid hydroxylase (fatty acid hydroxylase superfamily)